MSLLIKGKKYAKKKQKLIVLIFGIFLFIVAILPVTAFAQNYEDSPFGFHYANKLPDYASDLGIKWVRVNAVWGQIQPSSNDVINGIYYWTLTDTILNAYPENSRCGFVCKESPKSEEQENKTTAGLLSGLERTV